MFKNLPGNPVVKISPSIVWGVDLTPGQGAKISQALQSKNQNIKKKTKTKPQKQYCKKLNKDFKEMVHIKKES